MSRTESLRLEAEGVLELLREYDALRTWEFLRTARAVVTVGELAAAMGDESRVLQRHLDLLARHRRVHVVRARKPRRSVGYRVATERIVVVFDDSRAESVQKAIESSDSVQREFERCVERHADPEFHSKAGVRFQQQSMLHFTKEDHVELRRRMMAVIEFLATPRPRPPQPTRSRGGRLPAPAYCNQAISIRLDPLVGQLLPLPAVWMTPNSKLAAALPDEADRTGIPGLAPREREVALALAARLSGHARRKLGER